MGSSRATRLVEFSGLFIATYLCFLCGSSDGSNVACFFTSWAQYRPDGGRFKVSDINSSLCSHLYYAFAQIAGTNLQPYEFNDSDMWIKFNDLKKQNPNLKTLLSVGGATLSAQFPNVASTKDNRDAFINSAISLLRSYGFDGLDIDWEYPGTADKNNFKLLIHGAFTAFEAEGMRTNRPRLLLSVSTPAGLTHINEGYDVRGMIDYLDLVNVMAYDYHGIWEEHTNLATPLTDKGDTYSVTTTINHYLSLGATPEKLQLGLAFYARTWSGNVTGSSIGAYVDQNNNIVGDFTNTPGILSYYEVCTYIRDKRCLPQYENTYGFVYYCSTNQIWMTFENITSLEVKLNFIKEKALGGAMIWALDFDDFTGQFCGMGKFPLTKLVSSLTHSPSTAAAIVIPLIKAAPFVCPQPNGFFADRNCSFYIQCVNGISSGPFQCPATAIFNPNTITCESLATTTYTCQNEKCPEPNGFFADTNCSFYIQCVDGISSIPNQCPVNSIFNPNTQSCENVATTTYTCPDTTTTTVPDTITTTIASTTTLPDTTTTTVVPDTPTTTVVPDTTTTTTTRTTTLVSGRFRCSERDGVFADPNCCYYNICSKRKRDRKRCPTSTIFHPYRKRCENIFTTNYRCPAY